MIDRALSASGASACDLASSRPSLSARFSFSDILAFAFGCLERIQQRRALARLDDRMLSDIGVSRADVEGELSKPFWRA